MTIQDHKNKIQAFADKHGLNFEDKGEVGFGRECVGLSKGTSFIDFNPISHSNHDYIEKHYNESLYDMCPKDAYHKHDCIAVLGHGDDSIIQLSEWVDKLDAANVKLESYANGATGVQAMFSGTTGWCFTIPKQ